MTKFKKELLKVLFVIHGYPPYYMAGSEVYTASFTEELSKKANVYVFTRIEDEFQKPYNTYERKENNIRIFRVNKPFRDYTFRRKYQDFKMATIFKDYLKIVKPNIVHIGHLSHLTTQIIEIIYKYKIPIVFTLHDYWMMCIRGQLIKDDLTLCRGPCIKKCMQCNAKYFMSRKKSKKEIKIWLKMVSKLLKMVDLFIAPSKFLLEKYIEFGIPENKIVHMDYGFDLNLFKGIKKTPSDKLRFGFLGRIIPVKGISLLIDGFNKLEDHKAELNIYGKLPKSSLYLKERCKNSAINFIGGYHYKNISKVLSNIDVLVVPSIWYENSPLVIHESFLAKIPVITSNLGGMAELVQNERNGLLFKRGDVDDLADKMNRFIEDRDLIEKLIRNIPRIRSIQQDVAQIEKLYHHLIESKEAT
jgi:glycosyltransferase involved in cell wall biosynthesis